MASKRSPGCGCCGEVECDCTDCTEDVRSLCACSNEDYGVETTIDDLTVDVSGTGYFAWSAGIPTIDITGTFVLACDTKQTYVQWAYWKEESSIHYFSYKILNFGWFETTWAPPFGSNIAIVASVETGTFTKNNDTNSYSTRTSVTPVGNPRSTYVDGLAGNVAVKYVRFVPSTYLAHFCEHDSVCREECDPGTTIKACPSGTLSGTETDINQSSVTIVLTV